MGAFGFPALDIRPPESPISQLAGVEQVKAGIQRQQMGDIELQNARLAQTSNQVLMESFARNNGDFNATYADAAASGKVAPSILLDFRAKSIAAQTQMASLDEKKLDNLTKIHDFAANELEAFKSLPVEQRTPDALRASMGRLATQGIDVSKLVPTFQDIANDPSDANLRNHEIQLKGQQWLLANEKAQREAASAPTPEMAQAQHKATLDTTIAAGNKDTAEASLDLERKRQLGQITPVDVYNQQQENFRAALSRQATFSNELQKNGLGQLDKMFTDPQHGYTQFLAQAAATKNAVMQARNGSELAASLEPLMTASGVLSFAGIHRINQVDVNQAGPAVGSLYRKVNSILDKVGSGKVPEDTQREIIALMDGLTDAKHAALLNGANMVAANAGLDPTKTMIMDRSGVISTLDKAGQANPRVNTAPSNAPIQVKDPQGGIHTFADQASADRFKKLAGIP